MGSEDFGTGYLVKWATLLVSVIIVSFNTRDLLHRCLASLEDQHEVIVVDNASKDGSVALVKEEFPSVILIENSTNKGFGAANNQGLRVATGDVALLLNSDAYAEPGAIEKLAQCLESPEVVACGGRLVDPDTGATQNSCCNELTLWAVFCEQSALEKLLPNSNFFSPYWQTQKLISRDDKACHEVEQVMGACVMLRLGHFFDESFFLYCEDTELCHRLRMVGKILYCPDAVFGHELGGSSTANRYKSISLYNRGKELYFALHHGKLSSFCCLLLNRLGAFARLLLFGIMTVLTLGAVASIRSRAKMWTQVLFAPKNGYPLSDS